MIKTFTGRFLGLTNFKVIPKSRNLGFFWFCPAGFRMVPEPLISRNLSKYAKAEINSVICSPEDKRSYRGYELINNLKILLISDPETDKSAASLDVNIGSMHDPVDIPGLAHFCEHMLFMGTKKYPAENNFENFLSMNGGYSNAFTDCDHTNFYFDVAPESLEGAIDRFAQFFISPLFKAETARREAMAVDAEFKDSLKNDEYRTEQLIYSLSKEKHDFNKFSFGNRKTLLDDLKKKGVDVRNELLKFYESHYSANLMALAVLGKETLDELAQMVLPLFCQVENKNFAAPRWDEHPYGFDQVCRRINVTPVKDLRTLNIYFPIPDLRPHYRSKPDFYVSHVLGYEGPGSLLSELKQKGLVNTLCAHSSASARGFGFFIIELDLTEEGLKSVDSILHSTFLYIKMLKSSNFPEWIHREVEKLNAIHFRFQDKKKPEAFVTELSCLLHDYPIEEVLFAPSYMMADYDIELINHLMSFLTPNNFFTMVLSSDFKGLKNKEKWYRTEYNVEKFPTHVLEEFMMANGGPDFKLPTPNEFIPDDFNLISLDPNTNRFPKSSKFPDVILGDHLGRLWYKQDEEYHVPKSCIFVHFKNPLVYSNPLNAAASYMYGDLFRDYLTEYVYNAGLAGLQYSFDNDEYGFLLKINGYNEKQQLFLGKLVEKLIDFQPKIERFEILNERYLRYLHDFAKKQPYKLIKYYTNLILSEKKWPVEELIKEAEALTIEHIHNFKSQFFDALYLEIYIHGNLDKQESSKISSNVKQRLKSCGNIASLSADQLNRIRTICLADGSDYLFEIVTKTHSNSALGLILQTGVENPKQNMLNELTAQILNEPFFDVLRTKEQLGYIVESGVKNFSGGSHGLYFTIQGEKSPQEIEKRVEIFLEEMEAVIGKMSSEDFEKHKSSLKTQRLEKPETLSECSEKCWNEIHIKQYHFNRDNVEVCVLENVTKSELIQFYKERVSKPGSKRRCIAIHVYSEEAWIRKAKTNGPVKKTRTTNRTKIEDIGKFKSGMPYYELPQPYMEVPVTI